MSDTTAGILGLGLVLGTLAIMASRTLAPIKEKPRGKIELVVRLPLLQRALSQKINVLSVCTVVVLGGGALTSQRVVSPLVGLLALVVMLGLIAKRQTLVITSQGMLVHNAAFRSWKDFDTVSVRPGKLVFHSPTKLASLSVYIPSKRRDDVVGIVRKHLPVPPARSAPPTTARRSKQHRVA